VDEGTDREMQHAPTFGREPVWGFWGDLVAIGVSSRYEIRAYGADGSLARIVRREHSPRVPTPEDIEADIESRILLYYADAMPSEQEYHRRNYRSAPVAEHFPVFTSIMVDKLDHLWIREYDLPREERPRSRSGPCSSRMGMCWDSLRHLPRSGWSTRSAKTTTSWATPWMNSGWR